jgi:hypothetical protein
VGSKLYWGVFPVVDIESRQADIEDFFFTKGDEVTRGDVPVAVELGGQALPTLSR